jgi:hypothetical protein
LEAGAASFAAVAVYLIRDHLHDSGRTEQAGDYEAAVRGIVHLLPAATPEQVSDRATGLSNSRGFPVDADEVIRVISMIVQDDPLADAIEFLSVQHSDWEMHVHQAARTTRPWFGQISVRRCR